MDGRQTNVEPQCADAQERRSGCETGWLLESTTPWPDGAVYWFALLERPYRGPRTGLYHRTTYTSDPNKALRFDSKAAAEDYRDCRCEGAIRFDLVASEHEWPE